MRILHKTISREAITVAIRNRAQELWMKRRCASGDDWKDWFEAESQIKKELRGG